MKSLKLLRLVSFLTLTSALYASLLWKLSTIIVESQFYGVLDYVFVAIKCIAFLIFGTIILGALSIQLGRINPYGNRGINILVALISIIWLYAIWYCFREYRNLHFRFTTEFYLNFYIGFALLATAMVKTFKLIALKRIQIE